MQRGVTGAGGEFQEGEEPLSDIYLKRWLKASSWHVDGVESFIVKHASWRYDMCPNGRIKEVCTKALGVSLQCSSGKHFSTNFAVHFCSAK